MKKIFGLKLTESALFLFLLCSCASIQSIQLSKAGDKAIGKMLEHFCSKGNINQFAIAVGNCEQLIYESEDLSPYCADNIFILQEDAKRHFAVLFRTDEPRRGQVGFNNSKKLLLHTERPNFAVDIVTRGDTSKINEESGLHQRISDGRMHSGLAAVGNCKRAGDLISCHATLKNLKSAKGQFTVKNFYQKTCE